MDKCKYHLNIGGVKTTFYSDKELTDFIKDNIELDKESKELSIKYSESGELKNLQDIALEELSNIDAWNPSFVTPNRYCQQEHLLGGKMQLLSPYFNDANFMSSVSEMFRLENPSMSEEEINNKVKDELESDNKMVEISKITSRLLKSAIKGKTAYKSKSSAEEQSYDKLLEKLIVLVNKYNGESEEYSEEKFGNLKKDLDRKFTEFGKYFTRGTNKIKTNQYANTNEHSMNAIIDILEISPEGIPNIYEVKTSRRPYDQWDSAKKLTTDYILGVKRQLLSNYISTSDSMVGILEILIPTVTSKNEDGEEISKLNIHGLSITVGDNRATSETALGSKGAITTNLKTLLPSRIVRDKRTEGILGKNIKETISAMFPKYQFRSKRIIQDIDAIIEKAKNNSRGQKYISISNNLDALGSKIQEERDIPGWEERFRKKVEEYAAKWNDSKDS